MWIYPRSRRPSSRNQSTPRTYINKAVRSMIVTKRRWTWEIFDSENRRLFRIHLSWTHVLVSPSRRDVFIYTSPPSYVIVEQEQSAFYSHCRLSRWRTFFPIMHRSGYKVKLTCSQKVKPKSKSTINTVSAKAPSLVSRWVRCLVSFFFVKMIRKRRLVLLPWWDGRHEL